MGLLSWISGYDEDNAERAAAADVKLRELNQKLYGVAYVNQDEYLNKEGAEQAISADFKAGLAEGPARVRSGLDGLIGGVLGFIPFKLWVILGIGLFLYMGGFAWLKGRLGK